MSTEMASSQDIDSGIRIAKSCWKDQKRRGGSDQQNKQVGHNGESVISWHFRQFIK